MNIVRTILLLAMLTGLLLTIGFFFGGTKGMTVMLVVSLLMNFTTYWFSDKILLSMYGAKELFPKDAADLNKIVSTLSQRAKLPTPKIYIINTDIPNTFATGRNPKHAAIAVTAGILKILKYEEIEGVIAHELAHIKNRDTLISTIVATVACIITMIANIAQWTAFLGLTRGDEKQSTRWARIVEFIFLVMLAPLAAAFIQLGISRSREFQADETGSAISGNPISLASALEIIECCAQKKVMSEATPAASHMFIVNPFSGAGSWLMSLFSTHPITSDRVAKLRKSAKRIR